MQTICRVLAQYFVLIKRLRKPPVEADSYVRPHMDDQLVKMQIFTEVYAPEAHASGVYT